jgi:hypothetical protein
MWRAALILATLALTAAFAGPASAAPRCFGAAAATRRWRAWRPRRRPGSSCAGPRAEAPAPDPAVAATLGPFLARDLERLG